MVRTQLQISTNDSQKAMPPVLHMLHTRNYIRIEHNTEYQEKTTEPFQKS